MSVVSNCPKCLFSLKTKRCFLVYIATDMPNEGRGGAPNIFKKKESWLKVGHTVREMVTVFSVTFFY